jgi:hypothetical protein
LARQRKCWNIYTQIENDDLAVKKDEAMGDAKKNCRLMILDFRLEAPPPTADWLMLMRSATIAEVLSYARWERVTPIEQILLRRIG